MSPPNKHSDVLRVIGRRVKRARLNAGMTQEKAGDAAQIEPKRWQRLEAGSVNTTVKTLVRVANSLGVTFWSLVGARAPASESKKFSSKATVKRRGTKG